MSRKARGFSLVETLVALAIAAGVLGAFFSAGASANLLRLTTQRAADSMVVARDLLAAVGVDAPLAPGERTGVAVDGSSWQLEVTPLQDIAIDGAQHNAAGLYLVRISVLPRGARTPIIHETLRVDEVLLR